jgi:hypothetical protein
MEVREEAMPPFLRIGVAREVVAPSESEIRAALETANRFDIPVVSVHREDGWLEAEEIIPGKMMLHIRLGAARLCSRDLVDTRLATRAMVLFLSREGNWADVLPWREYVIPGADLGDLSKLCELTAKIAVQVETSASHLRGLSREWILRKLLRDRMGKQDKELPSASNFNAIARSELEHYLLMLLESGPGAS